MPRLWAARCSNCKELSVLSTVEPVAYAPIRASDTYLMKDSNDVKATTSDSGSRCYQCGFGKQLCVSDFIETDIELNPSPLKC